MGIKGDLYDTSKNNWVPYYSVLLAIKKFVSGKVQIFHKMTSDEWHYTWQASEGLLPRITYDILIEKQS